MSFLKIFVRLQTEKNMRDVLIEVVRFVLSLQSECIEKTNQSEYEETVIIEYVVGGDSVVARTRYCF